METVRGFPVILAYRIPKPTIKWIRSTKRRAHNAIAIRTIAINPMYDDPVASVGVFRVKRVSEKAKHKSETVDSQILKETANYLQMTL